MSEVPCKSLFTVSLHLTSYSTFSSIKYSNTLLNSSAKISVLFLTYIAYVCYHMTRKPIAVVKSVLHRNCSDLPMPKDTLGIDIDTWCDYAPFSEFYFKYFFIFGGKLFVENS